jgi:broad specificity phosphatase PhoE
LARHGNTFEEGQTPVQIGITDLPLTQKGREQAEAIAQILPPVDAVYSGTLKRQKEFAELAAKREPFLEPALNEIDYGLWEGLTAKEIETGWPQESKSWKEGHWPEGIFKSREHYKNGIDLWRKTLSPNTVVFAVTSGGILRLFHPEKVSTGHFCELEIFPNRIFIKSWNCNPQVATLKI